MSTFAELKYNVSYELGLDQTASGIDDTLLGRRINQAVKEVLKLTHCYVKTASFPILAATNEYQAPSDLIALKKVINSQNVPLDHISPEEIYDLRRASATTGNSVWKYAIDGANLIMLYPTPSASGNLTLYYVPAPAQSMTAGTHNPETVTFGGIPNEFHDVIEYWACWRIAMMDNSEITNNGVTYKQLFDQSIFEMRKTLRRRGGRKMSPVRLGWKIKTSRDPATT